LAEHPPCKRKVFGSIPKAGTSAPRRRKAVLLVVLGAGVAGGPLQAAERVIVSGSIAERAAAEAPHAISLIDAETLRAAGPLIHLGEALVRVPGVLANHRHNHAQDLQLSSRGFGARAGFGVRGLRLLTDGIPATMPDGQGQPAHFDLAGAERVEVLRGPFSVLYGNSSGGVVALFTAPATRPEAEAALDIGSFGLRQLRAGLARPLDDGFDARASVATMQIEGFRPHSRARRGLAHLRLGWRDADDRLTLRAGAFEQPAQDPLGLTRAQFDADPRQTTAQATRFDTRKSARQQQAGFSWQRRLDGGALREARLTAYTGAREVVQWLAIEPATQANPRHGGGVVDLDRRYHGFEARWRWGWEQLDLVAGVADERQQDARRGFNNFTGSGATSVLGTTGDLRRDESNAARTRDVFAQAEWAPARDWLASAGLRAGRVGLRAIDAYRSNGDDSGQLAFDYRNPVLGLRWQAQRGLALHASVARGFESPTLGELAYRPDGVGGFNSALRPQTSRQLELGAKARGGTPDAATWTAELAVFAIAVENEIGVATNAGGRSSFQNVGRTARRGVELAWQAPLGAGWRAALSLTTLHAAYVDGFLACAGLPCTAPTVPVAPGNRVAGTQAGSVWAELAWRDAARGEWAAELRGQARTAVNDANDEFAPGHALLSLRWARRFEAATPDWQAELQLRVDNAANRVAVASVIVNDANRRYFEPQAPRSVLLSLRLQPRR
jgi:iron complex outermembrane recepter protein